MKTDLLRTRIAAHVPKELTVPGASEAAVALILSPLKSGGREALFIRRAIDPRDSWSGQIGLPGGKREPGDTDLLETAIRETREEIAVSLSREERIGRLDDTQPKGRGLPPIVFHTYVFDLSKRRAARPGPEVDHAFWLPLDEIAACRKRVTVEEPRGGKLKATAYCVGPYVIWGATQRVLTRLFRIIN